MRNRIYRFVLVADSQPIAIPAQTYPSAEPPLLRTYHQTQDECIDMYYQENEFKFEIKADDADVNIQWYSSSPQHYKSNHGFLTYSDAKNWPKLVKWLHAYYYKQCDGVDQPDDDPEEDTMTIMFSITAKFRHYKLNWAQAEAVLEDMRKVLGLRESEWLDG